MSKRSYQAIALYHNLAKLYASYRWRSPFSLIERYILYPPAEYTTLTVLIGKGIGRRMFWLILH